MTNKSIILLSGGLDSLVSLGLCKDKYNVELALTFDYGQKSAAKEILASGEIADYYKIKHKIIKLEWLEKITNNALTSNEKTLPKGIKDPINSAKAVWVPNRNALFINIAASFAEAENYTHIIIGANKEEGETFPDNTQEFIDTINNLFKYSTLSKPKVLAPLINYNKNDIVNLALKNALPLDFVQSCYAPNKKHCGVCESCTRLKNALIANNDKKYIKLLFEN